MDKDEMISECNKLIKEQFALDKLPEADDTFSEFKADSLDMIEMVMGLEEKFNIEIADDEAENIETVGQVHEALAKKLSL